MRKPRMKALSAGILLPLLAVCLLLAAAWLALTHKETLSAIIAGIRPASPYAAVIVTAGSDQQADWVRRDIRYQSGDLASFRRFSFQEENPDGYETDLSIPGIEGTVRWYDQKTKTWQSGPLEGELPDGVLFIDTDQQHMILSQPYLYQPFDRASAEDRPRRPIQAAALKNGTIELNLFFAPQPGLTGELWMLQSDQPLVEWSEETKELWAKCVQADIHRLCYDGFYSASPSNYKPTSEDMFFRNPAAWVVNIFVRNAESSRAFEELGFAMCDALIALQNEQGFWPTEPQSDWLMAEYEIGPGFYDTRFNNDFTQTLFDAADIYGDKRFQETALKQIDFFSWLAEKHHYEFTGADGDGWLVEDYYGPGDGSRKKVHCALNHQLQEMKALYRAYEATEDERYLETADYLLRGVKLTRDQWLKEDGSLEYAYMPDGTMGLEDYPYLTYNDLFEVQEILTGIGRERDSDLQILMDSKKASMDEKGLTEYIK